jgi:hypothetical protein
MDELSIAGLLHGLNWVGEKNQIILEGGLKIEYSPSYPSIISLNALLKLLSVFVSM